MERKIERKKRRMDVDEEKTAMEGWGGALRAWMKKRGE